MNALLERVPPHDAGAERQVLGSMISDPIAAQIALEALTPEHFYTPNHRLIFIALCGLYKEYKSIDEDAVCTALGNGYEQVGGRDYIGHLVLEAMPTSVELHCATLVKRRNDQIAIVEGAALIECGYNGTGSAALKKIGIVTDIGTNEFHRPSELLKYDTANDPNCLVGQRWLCRGGALLIVGQSGLGKSSFAAQFAICMALGEPFFGIAPKKALTVLLIQAENDAGDLAEEVRGILNGLSMIHRVDELDARMAILTQARLSGDSFISWLRAIVGQRRPDLVVIDPCLSFIGGDVSSQETCSKFFRNGLNPISQQFGCTWVIVHHTGKPPKRDSQRYAPVAGEYSYLGLGSSEITNWARAIVVVREEEGGNYELNMAKRGSRAGLIDGDGNPCKSTYLRHGSRGIFWERTDFKPAPSKKEIAESDYKQILSNIGMAGLRHKQLVEVIMETRGCARSTACASIDKMLDSQRLRVKAGVYTVVPEESQSPISPISPISVRSDLSGPVSPISPAPP